MWKVVVAADGVRVARNHHEDEVVLHGQDLVSPVDLALLVKQSIILATGLADDVPEGILYDAAIDTGIVAY